MNANTSQIGGTHYRSTYQHWDFVLEVLKGRYLEGNITKYVTRARKKNGIQDLDKALHYLDKLIELADAGKIGPLFESTQSIQPTWDKVTMFVMANDLSVTEASIVNAISTWTGASELHIARTALKGLILQTRTRAEIKEVGAEASRNYVSQD